MSFLRIREIYHAVSAVPAEDRTRLLGELCAGDEVLRAEVEALLTASDRAGAFLAEPTISLDAGAKGGDFAALTIGPYRLLERLGEGGYGEVFLAEQSEPVRRRVALKMLKAGLDSRQVLARFEAERQTLAMMDHPGIARIFDAGTTPQGRPYFVMEFVDGVPVTEFCLLHKVPPRQRLELFCEICRAVQHAHMRGIIHRDLKPSNVLVAEVDGTPRAVVIDFGIAKAMRGMDAGATLHTGLRQLMGTPAYMSPEQAGLGGPDVDTRSDVYSLGVLLYELLTGVTPLDASQLRAAALAELQRRISEEVPPKPSTRVASLTASRTQTGLHAEFAAPVRLLRGDLDWIVMKALEKEPERRYETAAAFAGDVVRHLSNEPVSAGPPSVFYRLRKWTLRNRTAAAAATVMILAAAVGAGGLVRGYIIATREAAARKVQADRAESLLALQTQIFESANPESAHGGDYTVRQLLEDFSVRFRDPLGVEPEVEISLRRTVGRAWQMLGGSNRPEAREAAPSERERSDMDHAEEHFRAALALAVQVQGENSMLAASCRQSLGWLLRDRGFYVKAVEELRPAVVVFTAQRGAKSAETLSAKAMLATVLLRLDERTEALQLAREVTRWPGDSMEAVQPLQLAARVCLSESDIAMATAAGERALRIARERAGKTEGPRLIQPLLTLAEVQAAGGRRAEGIALAETAHRIAKESFGDKHPETSKAMLRLTALRTPVASSAPDSTAAAGTLRQAIGDAHPDTIAGMAALIGSVNPEEARRIGESFAGVAGKGRAAGAPVMVEKLPAWVQGLVDSGRLRDFEGVTRGVIEMSRRTWGEDHINTIDTERILAEMYTSQAEYDKALAVLLPNVEKTRRSQGEAHPLTTEGLILISRLHRWKKDYAAMEKTLDECQGLLKTRPQDVIAGYHWSWMAEIYHGRNRCREAAMCYARGAPLLTGTDDFETLLKSRVQEMRALQMTGFSIGARDICRSIIGQARERMPLDAEKLWTTEQSVFTALQGTLLWRDAEPDLTLWDERSRQALTPTVGRGAIVAMKRALTDRIKMREEMEGGEREAWERAVADFGALDDRTIAALRTWTAACGNSGGSPGLDKALAELDKVATTAEDALVRAEASCEAVWYRALFRGLKFEEALRLMKEGASAIPGGAPSQGTIRLLNRLYGFARYSGRMEEAIPLLSATIDRMTGQMWPAEETVVLVPHYQRWLQGCPVTDPGEAWREDADFGMAGWGYKLSPLGNSSRAAPASVFETAQPFTNQLPLLARTTFAVEDPAVITALKLRLRCSDGVIIWINGREAVRRRVSQSVTFGGNATAEPSSPEPDLCVLANPDPGLLRAGVNVLAAAVYHTDKRKGAAGALLDCSVEVRRKPKS